MNEMAIRPMTEADLEAVTALERASFSHPWSEKMFRDELANPHARIDLLFCGGELAGYLSSWLVCGELSILNVVTAPAFRRRGVARRLLTHVIESCDDQELERVLLEVRTGNLAAIALYEKFGFRRDAIRRSYYPDGEDALLMTLIPSNALKAHKTDSTE